MIDAAKAKPAPLERGRLTVAYPFDFDADGRPIGSILHGSSCDFDVDGSIMKRSSVIADSELAAGKTRVRKAI